MAKQASRKEVARTPDEAEAILKADPDGMAMRGMRGVKENTWRTKKWMK